jgi:hypothetical protein
VALKPALGLLFALFLLRAVLTFLSEIAAQHAAAAVKTEFRRLLIERIFALGPAYIAGESSADLATTLTDGVERWRAISPATCRKERLWRPCRSRSSQPSCRSVPSTSLALGARPSREAVALRNAMRADAVASVQGMAELLTYNAAAAMAARIVVANDRLIAREARLAVIAGLGAGVGLLVANATMGAVLLVGLPLVAAHRLPGPVIPLLALGALAGSIISTPSRRSGWCLGSGLSACSAAHFLSRRASRRSAAGGREERGWCAVW